MLWLWPTLSQKSRFHYLEQVKKIREFSEKVGKLQWYRATDTIHTMKEWTNYLSWPYGIQLSCVSLCMLYSDVKLNYKVKTLLAAHTGQNPAEAGFGQIRFMGGGNNDPNGMELMQRVTRWTIHRILKHDPDFDIMSLKEPLDQYIADLCNGKLEENEHIL